MITSLSQLDLNGSYTYADYLLWKFEERLELIKGRIFRMSAPSRLHQKVATNLVRHLINHLHNSPCEVYFAPFDVRLVRHDKATNKDVTTVVQPDICVICDRSKLDKRGCLGAPDIMIEILSPGNSRKEMRDKYQAYQENGVKEYWIIHPGEKNVLVFRLNDEEIYYGLAPLVEGDILITPILPGLEIDVTDIFKD
jgi:Uma2 family endonuclease